jgi:hypothetical protein
MDFAEAVEFAKKFAVCHPKVFKGFTEWGIYDTETDGYVVFVDTTLVKESGFSEMEEYIKNHKLRIDCRSDYFLVCTHC